MERSFAKEVQMLAYGAGKVLHGEGILAITKGLLQAGVSYVGGYPGAPVSHLMDVLADANEILLRPLGIYFDASASEAAAAAMLGASINYPIRGAVAWKSIVGTNVAADPLSHLASAGVIGGALVIVGEDYGAGASVLQERTHSFAMKSSMPLLDPRNDLNNFARMVEEGFGLSEASHLPVFFSIRIRAAHLRGSLACKDNVPPRISMLSPLREASFDFARINLPPSTYAAEAQKVERRIPAAQRYILERHLNEHLPGEEGDLGIILQGGLYNTTLRVLRLLGAADAFGACRVSLLVMNALHPLVPEEILGFLRGKRQVLIVEEGMPNYLEQQIKALAYEAGLGAAIHGKDLLSPHGEYVPELVLAGARKFLAGAGARTVPAGAVEARYAALTAHLPRIAGAFGTPVAKRPPSFCTGCPERPVFSALKILREREREVGDTHVAADIGCHSFSTMAPFNTGNTILGYGMGLASGNAAAPLFGKRTIALMGDGGFWHNGLTSGVANAVFNKQDSVLVILQNFYTSATGQQHNPSTGTNPRREPVAMSIPEALKGVGVRWIRTVNPYRVGETLRALREALSAGEGGLKVVIAKGECRLERQRREKPADAQKARAGGRVEQPRFGVDPDVCTGDHSCMRFNGCPSLTLKPNPDPLRADPIAHIDPTCVGCGLCGEVAHAAVLCPSFYEVRVITNPSALERLAQRVRWAVIRRLAGGPDGAAAPGTGEPAAAPIPSDAGIPLRFGDDTTPRFG